MGMTLRPSTSTTNATYLAYTSPKSNTLVTKVLGHLETRSQELMAHMRSPDLLKLPAPGTDRGMTLRLSMSTVI